FPLWRESWSLLSKPRWLILSASQFISSSLEQKSRSLHFDPTAMAPTQPFINPSKLRPKQLSRFWIQLC
ncbi:MAG TPA: hypothetical protein V6D16_20605, partial [Candidatus Obscuribacterales bacterium]